MKKDDEAAVERSSLLASAAPVLGAAAAAPILSQCTKVAEGPNPAVSQSSMELLQQKSVDHSHAWD